MAAALVYLLLPTVLGQLLAIATELRLKRFVQRVPRLRHEGDMDEYRGEVRWQMYAALVGIPLLLGPPLGFVFGCVLGYFKFWQCLLLIAPGYAGLMIVERIGARARMKELPADNEVLVGMRDAIVATWRKKALPDF